MSIDKTIFKAYDIRGLYPGEFDENAAYRIIRAYAQLVKPKLVVVGRDMRVSGTSLLEPVTRALLDQGCDVQDVGLVSTPMYYYSVNAYAGDAGVMVTASHNPPQYNGFKLTGPKAIPSIALVSNDAIYELAESGVFEEPAQKGKFLGTVDPMAGYVDAVLKTADITDFRGLKIVIDTANGMGGMVMPHLLANKNCTVYPLYWDLDGNFPNHEANPLKDETLDVLKAKVRETDSHLGVAYDGDADRVGFVDENGETVPGDVITALIAREMLKSHPGATILYDLRSSWTVKEEITKAGGKALMCKVGHGLIKRQMREVNALFAGELSSHYYFSDFYITDNGDLAMLNILRLLIDEGKPFSALVKPIMRYFHSPEINSKVADTMAKLAEIKAKYGAGGTVIELDGLTVEYADWWFNLRASQTEPYIRLNVEAKTKDMMDEKVAELLAIIRA